MWIFWTIEPRVPVVVEKPHPRIGAKAGGTYCTNYTTNKAKSLRKEKRQEQQMLSSWKSTENRKPPSRRRSIVFPSEPNSENDTTMLKQRTPARSKPPSMWYFSSNHIQINRERHLNGIAPLIRKSELDAIARAHAVEMANNDKVCHSKLSMLEDELKKHNLIQASTQQVIVGENVMKGTTIRDIHRNTMDNSVARRRNILDESYRYMGMGTAPSDDGTLFMCQLFMN
mmetsp:Transcript_25473/g.39100  ORF Transcript_25473/g.39100 Transcript_25473/m.39100 type:complete len:228 (+) Transcript_25473:155-838(+)